MLTLQVKFCRIEQDFKRDRSAYPATGHTLGVIIRLLPTQLRYTFVVVVPPIGIGHCIHSLVWMAGVARFTHKRNNYSHDMGDFKLYLAPLVAFHA